MANIMDYMDWRGDLSFEADEFNEVDNLILAQLAYVDLRGSLLQRKMRRQYRLRRHPDNFGKRMIKTKS